MEKYINSLGENAKAVAASLSILSTNEKNNALAAMAKALRSRSEEILTANAEDMAKGKENNLNSSLLDRLLLTEARIESMALGLEDLIPLKDPIGATIEQWKQPNGLEIARKRVPLGVIAMIYEARPNVTVDAAGLAFKTGNALILKGGKVLAAGPIEKVMTSKLLSEAYGAKCTLKKKRGVYSLEIK